MAKGTVNKVILIGRAGSEPELKYTPSGAAVANFSIATNEAWKDKEGNWQDRTEWHRLVVWNKTAEMLAERVKKGHRVYVEGQLRTRDWVDKDGNKRYMTEINVAHVQLLERRDDADLQPENSNAPAAQKAVHDNDEPENYDDDLPF